MNEGLKSLYAGIGALAAGAIAIVWGGYAFSVLWAWFIVTTFAAPALAVSQAIGLTLVLRFAVVRHRKDGEDAEPGKALANAFFVPLIFLAFGWIVKQWVPA